MTLRLENVSIAIGPAKLFAPFTLSVGAGEIVTLMGPSGCGKSSLLAYIAGDLAAPLQGCGKIELSGKDLAMLRPEHRRVGRLFQDDLLFPHLTVGENLLFGMPRGHRAERRDLMLQALRRIELGGLENRDPATLSGGQRARASLMRALLAQPRCMLLDEPFNKLDQALRKATRAHVFDHLTQQAIPCLLVTHDIGDAPRNGRIYRINSSGEWTHV
jgi:putative thiamine transport system ATP-binding protein